MEAPKWKNQEKLIIFSKRFIGSSIKCAGGKRVGCGLSNFCSRGRRRHHSLHLFPPPGVGGGGALLAEVDLEKKHEGQIKILIIWHFRRLITSYLCVSVEGPERPGVQPDDAGRGARRDGRVAGGLPG